MSDIREVLGEVHRRTNRSTVGSRAEGIGSVRTFSDRVIVTDAFRTFLLSIPIVSEMQVWLPLDHDSSTSDSYSEWAKGGEVNKSTDGEITQVPNGGVYEGSKSTNEGTVIFNNSTYYYANLWADGGSLEMWVNPQDVSAGEDYNLVSSGGDWVLLLREGSSDTSRTLVLKVGADTWRLSPSHMTGDVRRHIVVTYDSSSNTLPKMYVDGVEHVVVQV